MKLNKPFLPAYSIEEFAALTREEKIVAVCKDALLQQKHGTFRASSGYMNTDTSIEGKSKEQVQNLISENRITCVGCAKSGVFMALIHLKNDFSTSKFRNLLYVSNEEDRMKNYVADVFTEEEYDLIEAVYEGAGIHMRVDSIYKRAAVNYDETHGLVGRYNRPKKFYHLMKAIIKCKGDIPKAISGEWDIKFPKYIEEISYA